jgi:hypothetical protein
MKLQHLRVDLAGRAARESKAYRAVSGVTATDKAADFLWSATDDFIDVSTFSPQCAPQHTARLTLLLYLTFVSVMLCAKSQLSTSFVCRALSYSIMTFNIST